MRQLREVLKCVHTVNDFFYSHKDVRNRKKEVEYEIMKQKVNKVVYYL